MEYTTIESFEVHRAALWNIYDSIKSIAEPEDDCHATIAYMKVAKEILVQIRACNEAECDWAAAHFFDRP